MNELHVMIILLITPYDSLLVFHESGFRTFNSLISENISKSLGDTFETESVNLLSAIIFSVDFYN